MALSAFFSLSGTQPTDAERSLFRAADPLGFILFKRNIETPDQLRALTGALRDLVGRDCAVLIDQEGGRVQRMGPPHWKKYPAAGDLETEGDVRDCARGIAGDLAACGIDVNCAPVMDVSCPQTHEAIGDRAFSDDPDEVYRKAKVVCEEFIAAGITPVLKHLPGQGRAAQDSHHDLPAVGASRETLAGSDFAPFISMMGESFKDRLWGMVSHILYTAIDPDLPASLSPNIINTIRREIGFDGFLISDDVSMGALESFGNPADRAGKMLAAGLDAALYCAGKLEDMERIAGALGPLRPESLDRYERTRFRRRPAA